MPEHQSPHIPSHLLQRTEFIQACADRNLGEIFRLAVKWAGFSRSLVSRQCGMNITRVSNYIQRESASPQPRRDRARVRRAAHPGFYAGTWSPTMGGRELQ